MLKLLLFKNQQQQHCGFDIYITLDRNNSIIAALNQEINFKKRQKQP